MSNRKTPDALPGAESIDPTLITQARVYAAWLALVARHLSGFGFLDPTGYVWTVRDYCARAYELGMFPERCARNIAKAHEEKRELACQKGAPSGVV